MHFPSNSVSVAITVHWEQCYQTNLLRIADQGKLGFRSFDYWWDSKHTLHTPNPTRCQFCKDLESESLHILQPQKGRRLRSAGF